MRYSTHPKFRKDVKGYRFCIVIWREKQEWMQQIQHPKE